MTNARLKCLLKTASEIINLFLESNEYASVNLNPFINSDEPKTSASLCLTFNDTTELGWEFLEALSSKLSKTNIEWTITGLCDQVEINLS